MDGSTGFPMDPMSSQASLSLTISHGLLRLMSVASVIPCNHLILCHPHLLLPLIFPSIKVLTNELALRIRWPKHWNFSFIISPSCECSDLISFRSDWFDLLAIQGWPHTPWVTSVEQCFLLFSISLLFLIFPVRFDSPLSDA